jgi:hypothetical protein
MVRLDDPPGNALASPCEPWTAIGNELGRNHFDV